MLLESLQRQFLIPAVVVELEGAAANGIVIGKCGRIFWFKWANIKEANLVSLLCIQKNIEPG